MLVSVCYLAVGTAGSGPGDRCVRPPAGMASWWPGDGDANDLVASNHGTLENGATFALGMVDKAFSLDGIDDFIETDDVDLPATFTIDAWIFPNNLAGVQLLVNKSSDDRSSYYFCFDNFGKLVGSVTNSDINYTQYRTDAIALTAGEWQHVVMTYNGNLGPGEKMKFYVNGINFPASPLGSYDVGGTPNDTDLVLRLGIYGDTAGSPFNGLMDEVELFNRVLTQTEIAAETDTHAPSLLRVMRLLAGAGVFAERAEGVFALTPLGEPLRSDIPGSLRDLVMLFAGAGVQDSWKELEKSVPG